MSRIVVLGETLIDLGPEGHGPRIGGACANVAVTLARLGREVALIGAVGDDDEGAWLVDEIAKTGVEVSCIARVKGKKTGRVHLMRDGNSWRFRPEREDGAEWDLSEVHLRCIDVATDWLHVGVSSLAREPAASVTRQAIGRMPFRILSADLNARIVGFSNERSLLEACAFLAERALILKVSESDLRRLGKTPDRDGARRLHAQRRGASRDDRPPTTFATFGADGALGMWHDAEGEMPPKAITPVEPSGAGDAFMAGVIAADLQDFAFYPAHEYFAALGEIASTLGAHATTQIGATTALTDPRSLLGDLARYIPLDAARARAHSSS